MRFGAPRPIRPDDDSSRFDAGEASLDAWVQVRALKNERSGASRTFVSSDYDDGRVAGYYCLAASSLRGEDATGVLRRNMPDPIPVVLLGRLAVDRRYQGSGLGASLLRDAALKSIEASRLIGARAILVHALNEHAQRFYGRWNFELIPDSARVMFLLVADAEATIACELAR